MTRIRPFQLSARAMCDEKKCETKPDFRDEVARLLTFKTNWRCSLVSVADLAFNGFYSSDNADYAKCYMCGIELGGWELCDKVEDEHREHSPNCLIVTGDPQVINFPIDAKAWIRSRVENRQIYLRRQLVTSKREKIIHSDFQHFSTAQRRLATFNLWPEQHLSPTPKELSDGCFIYSGFSNIIKCVSCLGEISDLSYNADVSEIHAKLYPECPFVADRFGFDFINRVLNKSNEPPIKYLRNNLGEKV